jgi:hypothetical protein
MTGAPAAVGKQASQSPLTRRLPGTSSKHRATSCSHARFLRNAIANEAAAPSSLEARERID